MRELLLGLLDLALPPRCARCGALPDRGTPLCRPCLGRLPRLPEGCCPVCQIRPAPGPARPCTACSLNAGPLSACVSAFWFEGDVERWVRRFKYPSGGVAGLDAPARGVVRWLAAEAGVLAPGEAPGRIVPVPLHPRVLRHRGFNPAAVLAHAIARAHGGRVAPGAVVRTRDTPSQTGLNRAQRRRNVSGAFRARGTQPDTVWLVDDVVTTGATLSDAARALRGAGARVIVAVCAARTPPPGQRDASPGPALEPRRRTVDQ